MVGGGTLADWLFNNFPYNRTEDLNLDWVLQKVKESKEEMDSTKTDIENYKKKMDAEFKKLYDVQESQWNIINGTWREMLDKLVTTIIPQLITFGITDDGYFVAYIPEQWRDIQFFTDVSDFDAFPFGRLQLKYEVEFS